MSFLRIGVDVGGTNTDGVLLDPLATSNLNRGILAWSKSPTTSNPSHGIEQVIKALLETAQIDVQNVASVTIGTTHFTNAVVEKDRNRLAPVAVIRLCGPYSRDVYPGIDWPQDLRDIICQHCSYVSGGLEVDGDLIADIDESQIAAECEIIKSKGIKSVVVNGIFSPSDVVEKQEERVAEWVRKYYPLADVVISKEVANLGFVERENAAILNASILPFARSTIRSFEHAIIRLRLDCPLFLTQNDGTVLSASLAARLPIRTFSSGPTNSMCGAAFLVKNETHSESMLVVDIGGTTTDVGMLLANGLPRQAAAVTEIAGIRLNFSCPDVKSIGLGGGSIVRRSPVTGNLTIGPDSVGHHIQTRALVFGGDVPTATDYAVLAEGLSNIGNPEHIPLAVRDDIPGYASVVQQMIERAIDSSKTSDMDIPVLLVGGGAIIAPNTLKGASRVVKPEYSGVANAIGAAIARVSGTIDTVASTTEKTTKEVLEEISKQAVDKAVENGAIRDSITIAEMEVIPLQYVANKARVIVKVIGDFDFSAPIIRDSASNDSFQPEDDVREKAPLSRSESVAVSTPAPVDILSYRPQINSQREWIVSQIDLEWISTGCYILGTGGGGTPYPHFIRLREMMRKGAVVRVISPKDVRDSAVVAGGGGMGSPTVSIEKLPANEQMEAQRLVYDHLGYEPEAVVALEIGGGNGLQGMILGASTNMNIPTIDGDLMGRAYPTSWQITPVVLAGDRAHFMPTAISDGNGNRMMILSANSEKHVERFFRAALSEMGSHVGFAEGPCSGKDIKEWVIENAISLAWRIGRAVALCRAKNQIDAVAEVIVEEVGGKNSAKVLFKGKIVSVERKTIKGHVYGEVIISAADVSGSGEGAQFSGTLKIPFKNENLAAIAVDGDGSETVAASVPDLICVCDAGNGEAIGTPEYRYGLMVAVVGIQASERWTSTERGIEIGGPKAFGLDIDYKPLGVFQKPRSVIDEYVL
ncbi:DUF917-domain-containing protein [Mycena indigotica]|uniref:DUF917-domain-containing protein n=1 Tax=Mycena indigotica TaxID=2126181 RepID=A0A8H6W425_9AGAR|nr:DUF917-domain-containing protein [Mycena indigotica]KAF7302131.1 DUF917-domain-containing protein [Mycena indigotica]